MISGDEFLEFMELHDEWEEVFGEELPQGPIMNSGMFPMLRKCLKLKSQKPYDDYIKALVATGRKY
ncbi:MAG: hypothetical protein OXL41_04470 [Nitrospinae bacterium]|nr:hypothetical protein [Nitrospinota bacterium]